VSVVVPEPKQVRVVSVVMPSAAVEVAHGLRPEVDQHAETWPLLAEDDAVTVIVLVPDTVTGEESVPLLNTTRAPLAVSGLVSQLVSLWLGVSVNDSTRRPWARCCRACRGVRGGGTQVQRRRVEVSG